jgi:adenylyl-sulfate kinase
MIASLSLESSLSALQSLRPSYYSGKVLQRPVVLLVIVDSSPYQNRALRQQLALLIVDHFAGLHVALTAVGEPYLKPCRIGACPIDSASGFGFVLQARRCAEPIVATRGRNQWKRVRRSAADLCRIIAHENGFREGVAIELAIEPSHFVKRRGHGRRRSSVPGWRRVRRCSAKADERLPCFFDAWRNGERLLQVGDGPLILSERFEDQAAGRVDRCSIGRKSNGTLGVSKRKLGLPGLEIRPSADATLSKLAAKTLDLNEIGVCNMSVARPLPFDPYAENRHTGAFILIDRFSNETVAAGMIDFALRRATNIHLQNLIVSKAQRSDLMHHRPTVAWFTGIPGAGKSTIANLAEAGLNARGIHTIMLDGDNIRHGLNRDLGFTEPDRVENIRRVGEVAKLMTEAGLVVLCAFISPFRAERQSVRELLEPGEFIEIFVDTPLDVCIARDAKGLYRRALAGKIKNFTGVDQLYEAPQEPDIHLLAGEQLPELLADNVIEELMRRIR